MKLQIVTRRKFLNRLLLAGGVLFAHPESFPQSTTAVEYKTYLPLVSQSGVLLVGPTRTLQTPSAAAAVARDGDTILIDAGLYSGDVATWKGNNLTIRGVGGRAHLDAAGKNAGGKAIWVVQGSHTTIESVEFSGASVPDRNGAGIRQEGAGLTLRDCYFNDNEEGILAGDNAASEILIEYCEFARNGYGDGYSHNLYINHVKKLTFQYNYTHHARIGHLIKSRAYENYILYNRIMDESDGTSSYNIDLPNGGLSYVIGNLVQQGPLNDNATIVAYAEEGASNPIQSLYAVNNTIVNDDSHGAFFWINSASNAYLANNLLIGPGSLPDATTMTSGHNLAASGSALVDRAGYDYHLAPGSPAINAGIDPGIAKEGFALTPLWQYVHPLGRENRPVHGAIDVGAYEY